MWWYLALASSQIAVLAFLTSGAPWGNGLVILCFAFNAGQEFQKALRR